VRLLHWTTPGGGGVSRTPTSSEFFSLPGSQQTRLKGMATSAVIDHRRPGGFRAGISGLRSGRRPGPRGSYRIKNRDPIRVRGGTGPRVSFGSAVPRSREALKKVHSTRRRRGLRMRKETKLRQRSGRDIARVFKTCSVFEMAHAFLRRANNLGGHSWADENDGFFGKKRCRQARAVLRGRTSKAWAMPS